MTRDYYGNPPDEPDTVCECGAVQSFGFDFCAAGLCPECCANAGCHVECRICKRRVPPEDVCSCCGRCYRHDCKREEKRARREMALEAKGEEMRELC